MQKYAEYFEKLRLSFTENADQNKRETLNLVFGICTSHF